MNSSVQISSSKEPIETQYIRIYDLLYTFERTLARKYQYRAFNPNNHTNPGSSGEDDDKDYSDEISFEEALLFQSCCEYNTTLCERFCPHRTDIVQYWSLLGITMGVYSSKDRESEKMTSPMQNQ